LGLAVFNLALDLGALLEKSRRTNSFTKPAAAINSILEQSHSWNTDCPRDDVLIPSLKTFRQAAFNSYSIWEVWPICLLLRLSWHLQIFWCVSLEKNS